MRKVVYAVMVNTDLCEGKGPMVVRDIATNVETARKIANYHEPYGHQDQFCAVRQFTLVESFEEWKNTEDDEVRKKALGKLSLNERKVLGLE